MTGGGGRLVTSEQACKFVGCSVSTFHGWRLRSRLLPVQGKEGKSLLFRWSDVKAFKKFWHKRNSERRWVK